jgi:hypothetical protein
MTVSIATQNSMCGASELANLRMRVRLIYRAVGRRMPIYTCGTASGSIGIG